MEWFLVLTQVVLPLCFTVSLWRRAEWSLRDFVLSLLLGSAYLTFICLVLPWGYLPYLLRYVWPAVYGLAALRAVARIRRQLREGRPPARPRLSPAVMVVATIVLGSQSVDCVRGRFYSEPAVELAFPLRDGVYVVGQGGNHPKINYHNVSVSQKYALDISALNELGLRGYGLGRTPLQRYAIWGDTLYSPCDGVVRTVVNDRQDHVPPASEPENPAGNHVEIETEGVRIFLAHMQRGSVLVLKGDRVKAGDPLGKVGNSGNTTEPHLHIHAVRGGQSLFDGTGIPITFEDRFLVRNSVVVGR